MLKNILYLSIVGAVSFSVQANDLDDLEKELLGSGSISTTEDVSLDDLESLLSGNEPAPTKTVTNRVPDKAPVTSTPNKSKIDIVEVNPEEELQVFENNTDFLLQEFNPSRDSLSEMQFTSSDEKFLKYVPVGSYVKFKEYFYIPSTKDTFIFRYGKPTLKVDKDNFSACYIKFSKSEKPRELMAERDFEISKNVTKKALIQNSNKTVFFSTLAIDSPHIDYIKCLSNEKDTPLTINDFNSHFGGSVVIEFAEYEKI